MNQEEVKKDLIALCKKHNIIIYADEDEPCTVIADNPPEHPGLLASEAFAFTQVTDEQIWEF